MCHHDILALFQAADLAASGRLDSVIDAATKLVETHLDLNFIQKLAVPLALQASSQTALAVPAQHIAIASDTAFGFSYSHIIDEWAASGATISPFSPLNDEAPHDDAQFCLYSGRLSRTAFANIEQCYTFHARIEAVLRHEIFPYMVNAVGLWFWVTR